MFFTICWRGCTGSRNECETETCVGWADKTVHSLCRCKWSKSSWLLSISTGMYVLHCFPYYQLILYILFSGGIFREPEGIFNFLLLPRRGFLCRCASKNVCVRTSSSVCHAHLPKKSKLWKNLAKSENFGECIIAQIMFINNIIQDYNQ